MESIYKQQIHDEEVQEILSKTPRSLYRYSILSIFVSLIILGLLLFCFTYEDSQTVNFVIERAGKEKSLPADLSKQYDSIFIGKALIEQNIYAKIKDKTPVEIQLLLYPSDIYGVIHGVVYKSALDEILDNHLIELHLLIQLEQKTNKDSLVMYKAGMAATGTFNYSGGSVISRIFK